MFTHQKETKKSLLELEKSIYNLEKYCDYDYNNTKYQWLQNKKSNNKSK